MRRACVCLPLSSTDGIAGGEACAGALSVRVAPLLLMYEVLMRANRKMSCVLIVCRHRSDVRPTLSENVRLEWTFVLRRGCAMWFSPLWRSAKWVASRPGVGCDSLI